MAQIHPTAIVEEGAQIADSAYIGPFCTVGANVVIGEGCWFQSHNIVTGHTVIGKNNKFYAFAAVGIDPQDKKYAGEPTRLQIGDNNVIRENCTLSVGTIQDEGLTSIGNDNLLMANVHVAHDCRIGNGTIIANNVGLAGHVFVQDDVVIGGQSGVHQFVHIGKGSMISGGTMLRQDVLPYTNMQGYPGQPFGINVVGMRRHGYSRECIDAARETYRIIFREGLTVPEATAAINTYIETLQEDKAKELALFMSGFMQSSQRGLAR